MRLHTTIGQDDTITTWTIILEDHLTLVRRFLEPSNSTHRQYEALRAFFVDGLPSAEAAARFGYTPGSFRVLVHQFRQQPTRDFFVPPHTRVGHSASRNDFANGSSRCGNRTSPSTTSAVRWPTMASRSVRQPSPRSSRTKASPACRDVATKTGPTGPIRRGRCGRCPPTRPDAACASTPSSAACSCSCLPRRGPLDGILARAAFPVRR